MTEQHPITPPPELVEKWHAEAMKGFRTNGVYEQDIATQAARWAADLELEACCEYIWRWFGNPQPYIASLRAVRRPKPPGLKEQALKQLASLHVDLKVHGLGANTDDIRRALEALDD